MSTEDEDLTLPTDTMGSRLHRGNRRDTSPLSDGDPDDLATVDQKVEAFRTDFPDGQIKTKVGTFRDPFGIPTYAVTAKVREIRGGYIASKAHATRTRGVGDPYSAEYPLETAESVAISRALRFLGYTNAPKVPVE